LDALIPWLGSDSERHILVMFQNPSEIRPAGGFLGSYADATLKNGGLEKVDVHDINDIDNALSLKIIPPKPLQAQVTSWRSANANWFFDFSESAKKVLSFAEASALYSTGSATFDGAVAVSPKVIEDILALTGPITVRGIKFDQNNFLTQIQNQVEQGQAKHATYPKKILDELTSIIFPRLTTLNDAQKQEFLADAQEWLAKKDVMLYFKNPDFEGFFDYFGISGKVYELPSGFNGDYLALVDANVGGGKSDLFIKENITLESQLNSDGVVSNHLVIDRAHTGNTSKYWWYQTTSRDYLQIFTTPGSQISNFRGGITRTISAPIAYAKAGYKEDPLVEQIESSTEKIFNYPALYRHDELGKEVWSTWSVVSAGGKTEIVFDYTHRLYLVPQEGQVYEFVFEKQAGTKRHYKFDISAPVGFKFRENNLPVYEYESDDPPGRLIINLTLQKI